jgi:endonuclease/exonuclease/phosphatase family metal-dependent hydrolase
VLITRVVGAIEAPSAALRAELAALPSGPEQHAEALERLPALHAIEVGAPPTPAEAPARPARIAFWNAERLKYGAASARLVRSLGADALLLAEVDLGMARSGNGHTLRDLARAVGAGYVLGVEFVELGLGDARERGWHAGQTNESGLHGGGLLSPHALLRPALVRLETSGRWFDGRLDERRIGGRIAVMAELAVMGRPVLLVAVHYESHTDPADRLEQTRVLLDAVEGYAQGGPVLIGGDFNTNTFDVMKPERLGRLEAALAADPDRLVDPVRYEPMFELLGRQGYDWQSCNVALAATQRTRPDGTPQPPFGKIDWLFSRGLRCSAPAIVPAVDARGVAISDHEILIVSVEPI